MKRLVLILVLLSAPAWAHENSCPAGGSDGDRVAASASTTESAGKVPSLSFDIRSNWLCCNKGVASCTDFDTVARAGGPADSYVVSLEDTGGCTAVDVDVGFREDASGVNHTVGTITLSTDSLVIPGPRGRRVTATVNTATGCTTGVDLRLNSYYERGHLNP